MKIGIVDADLIGRNKHRFPNLVCEKISAYWKERGATVVLLTNYKWRNRISTFEAIYVSKVFTDTPVPAWIKETDKIHIGGTGFYFDKAPNLPPEIEHHMPDYTLYDKWIESVVAQEKATREKHGEKFNERSFRTQFREYKEYSIGFLTRGCFRKCAFCVNQKYDHVFCHSPLQEFYDPSLPKICLLDDNFLGSPNWKPMLKTLIDTGKPFKFKQGLDERLLTEEKCRMLFSARYDNDYTFAFDNIADYDLIKKKLEMIRKHTKTNRIKFYVLVGFESTGVEDIENAFKRIELLMRYHCLPYVMRFQNKNETPWKDSEYCGMYTQLARWCNQLNIFKKMSFRQFCTRCQDVSGSDNWCAPYRAMKEFEEKHPDIAAEYFDLRYETLGSLNKPWNPDVENHTQEES